MRWSEKMICDYIEDNFEDFFDDSWYKKRSKFYREFTIEDKRMDFVEFILTDETTPYSNEEIINIYEVKLYGDLKSIKQLLEYKDKMQGQCNLLWHETGLRSRPKIELVLLALDFDSSIFTAAEVCGIGLIKIEAINNSELRMDDSFNTYKDMGKKFKGLYPELKEFFGVINGSN